MNWTREDLIGPDGHTQGYPNNVSRAAVAEMEQKILDRFGPDELERTRRACGARSDWNRPPPRGSTLMYGEDYREPELAFDPQPEPDDDTEPRNEDDA